jgi:hypothetical protein
MNEQALTSELHKRNIFNNQEQFLSTLYSDIDLIIKNMEHSKDKYYCDDEDKLSHTIVGSLINLGYNATEQTKKNGSVDITVRTKDDAFQWIAEAKIGYGNQKIFEGLLQLLTRYVAREDTHAGLLIYYQKARSSYYFKDWLTYLYKCKWVNYCEKKGTHKKAAPLLSHLKEATPPVIINDCCYADVDIIKPSSSSIKIRCFGIDVHFDPLDTSGVTSKSIAHGQAKNRIRELYSTWQDGNFDSDMTDELFEMIRIYHSDELDDEYTEDE